MTFNIKVGQVKNAVDEMDEIIQEMESYQLELLDICVKLGVHLDSPLYTYIKSIKDEITHIYKYKCGMRNLQNILGSVIYEYVKTENNIKAEAEQVFIQPLDKRGENPLSQVTEQEVDQEIADFEGNYTNEVKKLNEFLKSGDSDDLTEDDIRHIKYLLYTAPELYRSIYLNHISKFKIEQTDNADKNAFYMPWRHCVTYSYPESFNNDPRGPYTVFFHECGHAIDDLGRDVTLREAIEYDVYYNENNRHSVTYIANMIKESGCDGKNGDVNHVIDAIKNGDINYLKTIADNKLYHRVKKEVTKGINDVTYEAVSDVYEYFPETVKGLEAYAKALGEEK